MLDALWQDLVSWWTGLSPEFVFLLALPLLVAVAGLAGDAVRNRRRRASVTARLAGRTLQP